MQLILESCHVVLGYDLRMDMVFDCVVLGRETECIPSHGIQHVVALHSALTCHDIQCGIRSRMTYVQSLSRRIRELYQCVIFGLGEIVGSLECFFVIPDSLPFFLYLSVIVRYCHNYFLLNYEKLSI